jgi:hypothetical protein
MHMTAVCDAMKALWKNVLTLQLPHLAPGSLARHPWSLHGAAKKNPGNKELPRCAICTRLQTLPPTKLDTMIHRIGRSDITELTACNAYAPQTLFSRFRREREVSPLCPPWSGAAFRHSLKIIALAGLLAATLPATTLAQVAQPSNSLTLGWDTDPNSGVAGYNVYYGVASRSYTSMVSVGNTGQATINGLTAGTTYYFAVTEYDASGQESGYSDEITYTVPLPTNAPPTITLTSPANGAVSAVPASINLSAGVAANGHSIIQVQFYDGATLLGAVASPPYSFSWNNVSAGTYSLSATAVYDSGSIVSSAAANVKVAARRLPSGLSVAAPPILRIQLAPDGSVVLSATVQAGQTYSVLASQDLKSWTVISTVTADAGGSVTFTDHAGTSLPNRMYRLQSITVTAPKLQIQATAGGPVILIGTGQPSLTYNVLSSQDLVAWTLIGTMTFDATGSGQFTDPAGASLPNCVYRLQGQ